MRKNKHGIPTQHERQPRGKKPVRKQRRTFITIIDGIEVTAVITNYEPQVKLLKKSGWREAQ